MESDCIYHIVPLDEYQPSENAYIARGFEADGFIHCSAKETVLAVANDYFASFSRLLLLEINTTRLLVECKFEAPAPIPGGGRSHLKEDILFPHVYGPINLDAIERHSFIENGATGFKWPEIFTEGVPEKIRTQSSRE